MPETFLSWTQLLFITSLTVALKEDTETSNHYEQLQVKQRPMSSLEACCSAECTIGKHWTHVPSVRLCAALLQFIFLWPDGTKGARYLILSTEWLQHSNNVKPTAASIGDGGFALLDSVAASTQRQNREASSSTWFQSNNGSNRAKRHSTDR